MLILNLDGMLEINTGVYACLERDHNKNLPSSPIYTNSPTLSAHTHQDPAKPQLQGAFIELLVLSLFSRAIWTNRAAKITPCNI